jgi:hypothetical protein
MGRAKQSKGFKTYTLTEKEVNYLKLLNLVLQYNVYKDKVFSGFLYEVCNLRFGYPEDVNLIFEIDLEDEKNELKLTEVPTEEIQKAIDKKQ